MDPGEFKEKWPGTVQSFEFSNPRPIVPAATTSFLSFEGLPIDFRVATFDTVFEFATTATPIAEIWKRDIDPMWALPAQWKRYWHIGEVRYTQHQAWICIEEVNGRVVILCMEDDDPITVVNDSIQSCLISMKAFLDWFHKTGGAIDQMEEFEAIYNEMKEKRDEPLSSYWKDHFDWADDSGLSRIEVGAS